MHDLKAQFMQMQHHQLCEVEISHTDRQTAVQPNIVMNNIAQFVDSNRE